MNFKIVSLFRIIIEDEKVVWNHPAFPISKVTESMLVEYMFAVIPAKYHEQYLASLRLIRSDGWDVRSITKDIRAFFPVLTRAESLIHTSADDYQIWSYLNHFAIFKLDILVQQASKFKLNVSEAVIKLLGELVEQANNSSAECFQVSVHYACKYFANLYPKRKAQIEKIIASENHKRLISLAS